MKRYIFNFCFMSAVKIHIYLLIIPTVLLALYLPMLQSDRDSFLPTNGFSLVHGIQYTSLLIVPVLCLIVSAATALVGLVQEFSFLFNVKNKIKSRHYSLWKSSGTVLDIPTIFYFFAFFALVEIDMLMRIGFISANYYCNFVFLLVFIVLSLIIFILRIPVLSYFNQRLRMYFTIDSV